ncbi:MAG: hypothetical protein J5621_02145 [Paludibacteraceae bacterium]|nr:hypothetical protein [Paludibacteraceae bacterium]
MKKIVLLFALVFTIFSCSEEKITSIEMTEASCEIITGEIHTLQLKHYPENLDNPIVQWTSSNPDVVIIENKSNSYCKIRAIHVGSTTITCTELSTGNNLSTTCNVIVRSSAKFNTDSISIEKGKSINLSTYVSGTSCLIEWNSSNSNICSIENGILYAHEVGNCDISGHIDEENVDFSCKVEVYPIQLTEIRCDGVMQVLFDKQNDNNNYYEIKYTLLPEGVVSDVKITSSDSNIVEVVNNHRIHVKQIGNATLILTGNNGIKATMEIYISEDKPVVSANMYASGDVSINGVVIPGKIHISVTNSSNDVIDIDYYEVYLSSGNLYMRTTCTMQVASQGTAEIASLDKSSMYSNAKCKIYYYYKGEKYFVWAELQQSLY